MDFEIGKSFDSGGVASPLVFDRETGAIVRDYQTGIALAIIAPGVVVDCDKESVRDENKCRITIESHT